MAATRTWVSGVGDDANPGSRTAPCKTFAGAISKTAAGGEISVLDPGGFGAVTITKSITINARGTLAGVLASGTDGIIVNAGANDVVILRNLCIDGAGTGLNGIKFLAGGALHVENCVIHRFLTNGIDVNKIATGRLFVRDTNITNCAGIGIRVTTTASTVAASIENVRMEQCQTGLRAASGSRVTMRNSVMAGNTTGLLVDQTVADSPIANLDRCRVSQNTALGIRSGPGTTVVRLSDCVIVDNLSGLTFAGAGTIVSFGNNVLAGNGTDGAPSSTALLT